MSEEKETTIRLVEFENDIRCKEKIVEKISCVPIPQRPPDSAFVDADLGPLWKGLQENKSFHTFTNFSENDLSDIMYRMKPFLNKTSKRGPKSTIPIGDALIITLTLFKSGLNYDAISHYVNVKSTGKLIRAISNLKPILYQALYETWIKHRQRPKPLLDSNFPYIALLCDSTSIQVFRPKCRREEAKVYWDNKNCIYALKKEIAVMASPPHFALFFQNGFVGSKHEYQHLNQTHSSYIEYLRKTDEEIEKVPNDRDKLSWAILLDKGYIGPDVDTSELRKIIPQNNNTSNNEEQIKNVELAKIRQPLEHFFGRLKKLWSIVRETYKYNHGHFDLDIDLCILLTNEHIRQNQLVELDSQFYFQAIEYRKAQEDEKNKKRKIQVLNYKAKQKRKLQP